MTENRQGNRLLPPWDRLKLQKNAQRVEDDFWPKARRVLARLPFARHLLAAWFAARDPATPMAAKASLMGALAYFVIPLDLLPDFIAILGYTDDATVLFAALRTVRAHLRPEHRRLAEEKLQEIKASTRAR